MKILFEKSFLKDIRKLRDNQAKEQIARIIDEIKEADSIDKLPNVKKMKGHPSAFRIRVGDYRLGLFIEDDQVIMSRFLHRKDIYKLFP